MEKGASQTLWCSPNLSMCCKGKASMITIPGREKTGEKKKEEKRTKTTGDYFLPIAYFLTLCL